MEREKAQAKQEEEDAWKSRTESEEGECAHDTKAPPQSPARSPPEQANMGNPASGSERGTHKQRAAQDGNALRPGDVEARVPRRIEHTNPCVVVAHAAPPREKHVVEDQDGGADSERLLQTQKGVESGGEGEGQKGIAVANTSEAFRVGPRDNPHARPHLQIFVALNGRKSLWVVRGEVDDVHGEPVPYLTKKQEVRAVQLLKLHLSAAVVPCSNAVRHREQQRHATNDEQSGKVGRVKQLQQQTRIANKVDIGHDQEFWGKAGREEGPHGGKRKTKARGGGGYAVTLGGTDP